MKMHGHPDDPIHTPSRPCAIASRGCRGRPTEHACPSHVPWVFIPTNMSVHPVRQREPAVLRVGCPTTRPFRRESAAEKKRAEGSFGAHEAEKEDRAPEGELPSGVQRGRDGTEDEAEARPTRAAEGQRLEAAQGVGIEGREEQRERGQVRAHKLTDTEEALTVVDGESAEKKRGDGEGMGERLRSYPGYPFRRQR